MDRDEFHDIIKEALDESLEKHLASVHEEMTGEFASVRKEMRDGFAGVKSEIGGVRNWIDNESFARQDLEHRIRKDLPKLPEASIQ